MAVQIMLYFGLDLELMRKTIERSIANPEKEIKKPDNIPLVKQAERALKITYLEAKMFKSELIGTEHLLLGLIREGDGIAAQFRRRKLKVNDERDDRARRRYEKGRRGKK